MKNQETRLKKEEQLKKNQKTPKVLSNQKKISETSHYQANLVTPLINDLDEFDTDSDGQDRKKKSWK